MKKKTKTALGVASAAAATGAALASAYYYYGSEKAAQHRRQLKSWAKQAEKDIVREAKKIKDKALTDRNVQALIAEAARRYKMTKDLDEADVRAFVAAMQKRWQAVRQTFKEESQKARKRSSSARGKQRRPPLKKPVAKR